MTKLADFIIKTADNCLDIRSWLKENNKEYQPVKLINGLDSSDDDSDNNQEDQLYLREPQEEYKDIAAMPNQSHAARVDRRSFLYSKRQEELIEQMQAEQVSMMILRLDSGNTEVSCDTSNQLTLFRASKELYERKENKVFTVK